MANLINTLRDKYPMYSDRSDGELLEAYRLKYHKDKTLDQNTIKKIGFPLKFYFLHF